MEPEIPTARDTGDDGISSPKTSRKAKTFLFIIIITSVFLLSVFNYGMLSAVLLVLPVGGALLERLRGGYGLVGGITVGILTFCGFTVAVYMFPAPGTTDYLGPVISLLAMAFLGAIWGLLVSVFVYVYWNEWQKD
jgi:hypothetical protein